MCATAQTRMVIRASVTATQYLTDISMISKRSLLRSSALALSLLIFATLTRADALVDMTRELTVSKMTLSEEMHAIWVPPEFILISIPDVDSLQRAEFITSHNGYAIFFVGRSRMTKTGEMLSLSRAEISPTTRLHFDDGSSAQPIDEVAIPSAIANYLTMQMPLINRGGAQSARYVALVFRDTGADGLSRLRPTGSGTVRLSVGGEMFSWKLPIVSMLAPAIDPLTGESFPANYLYNPFTGQRLGIR